MRSGVLISAALHAAFVASLMLSAPRAFNAAPAAIEVELVRAEDVDQPEKEQPKPEKPNVWDFPEEKPKFDLPRLSPTERNQPTSTQQAEASAKQKPAPAEATQTASQAKPSQTQQAALTPQSAPPAAPPPPAPAPSKAEPSVFDPASIPMLLDLPNAQDKGFDFEATTVANISNEERAAFRAHLRKCWKVPPGQPPAASTRVVLRVYLQPNGALASEPVLIEASASRDGPVVLLAAKRALKECQPFSFLPPDKYREWKVLDLSFTPRDMAGG